MLNFAGTCKPSAKAYTLPVAETTAAGCGNPIHDGGHRPLLAVFFRPLRLRTPSIMAGRAGQPSGWPVPSCRFSTPAVRPATPHVEMSGGPSSITMEAAMRQSHHAHSGIAYRSQTPDSVRLLERVSVALLAAAKEQRKPVAISLTGDAQHRPATLATEEAAMPEVLARSEQSRSVFAPKAGNRAATPGAAHKQRSQGQARPALRMTGHSIGLADRAFVGLVDAAGNERPYDLADALALAEHIDLRDLRNIVAVLRFDAEKGYLAAEDLAIWRGHEARILELLGA